MDPNQNTPIYSSPQPITSPAAPPAAINPNGVWPGAFGIYKKSARAVKFNAWTILGVLVLGVLASALADVEAKEGGIGLELLSLAANIFVIIFSVALTYAAISSAKLQKITLGQTIKKSFSFVTVKFVVMSLVIFSLLFLSLLALIIPFFFVMPRLMLAPYYLLDKNLGPIESIKASWREMKGHSLKAWGIVGVTILFVILFIVLVGIYFYIMYLAAFALLYLYVSGQSWDNQPLEVPAPAQQPSVPQPLQAQAPVADPSAPTQNQPNTVVPQAQPQAAATPTTPVQPEQNAQQEPNSQNNSPIVG